jgi:hypothetical protein
LEKHSSGSLSISYEPEVWLKGPVAGVPAVLQPAAHALLQTVEDVRHALEGFSEEDVWVTPGGAASIGFHLVHLVGATDRLCTTARGESLSEAQKAARAAEKAPPSPRPSLATLIDGVFHAGEHSQRHAGQIVTTAKILRSGSVVPSP